MTCLSLKLLDGCLLPDPKPVTELGCIKSLKVLIMIIQPQLEELCITAELLRLYLKSELHLMGRKNRLSSKVRH